MKQAPLQHNLPVFVPTGQQLTHFQQQRDGSQFILLSLLCLSFNVCLCPYMLDFEF